MSSERRRVSRRVAAQRVLAVGAEAEGQAAQAGIACGAAHFGALGSGPVEAGEAFVAFVDANLHVVVAGLGGGGHALRPGPVGGHGFFIEADGALEGRRLGLLSDEVSDDMATGLRRI